MRSRRGSLSSTSWRICRCARALADERGLDGFTMDDLASAAAVSRRTVFNHFAGKVDAVLGPAPAADEADLAVFRRGGPTGDLVSDLRRLADLLLAADELSRDELVLMRRLLLANPRLLVGVHDRFRALSELLAEGIEAREGPQFDRSRARVAVGLIAALFGAALEAFLDQPDGDGTTLAEHFDRGLAFARELFSP